MDDDFTRADEETYTPKRSFRVTATGDCAGEMEMKALDQAREFFGLLPRLTILPNYAARPVITSLERSAGNGKYVAEIVVQAEQTV
jgi:3-deoxy-D-arabino-heptulosonate 7-phosphate (DAHP) synthase class II